MPRNEFKITTVVLFCIFVFLIASSLILKPERYGDASNYYMITQSIIKDRDIKYEEKDIARVLKNPFADVPAGMYLIRNEADRSYYFAKPCLYSLMSAPFVFLLGVNGFIFFNAIMLWLMIYLGFRFLSERTEPNFALLVSILFFVCSLPFLYMYWIHPDLFCMSLVFISGYFWFRKKGTGELSFLGMEVKMSTLDEIVACVFIGLAAYEKLTVLAVFGAFFLDKVFKRDVRGAVRTAIVTAIPLLVLVGTYYSITGEFHSHGGDRRVYGNRFPFTGNCDFDNDCGNMAFSFDRNDISYDISGGGLSLTESIKMFPYSLFVYLFGRNTGILIYNFPIVLCLLSISKMERRHIVILISVAVFISYYALIQYSNYAGLGHAVGNRFFYIYPLFIFLVDKVSINKKFLIAASLILILGFPLYFDPMATSRAPPTRHTKEFPYTIFPLEMTLLPKFMDANMVKQGGYTYYLDGGFNSPENDGAWLEGDSSGTIFVIMENNLDDVNFSISTNNYQCPIRVEVKSNRGSEVINFTEKDQKGVVMIQSHPVFYIPIQNISIHAINVFVNNGCRPSEIEMVANYEASYNTLDKRYLGVFVGYPKVVGLDTNE